MSGYGNGVYMGLRDGIGATHTSVLFITNVGRGLLQLLQFAYRLYHEGLVTRNEVQTLEGFMKAYDGKVDLHAVPIEINGDYQKQANQIRTAMDGVGLHYYVLPDYKTGYNSPEPEIGDQVVFKNRPGRTFEVEDLAKNQAVFKDTESGERIIAEKFGRRFKKENPYHIEGKSPGRNHVVVMVPQNERQMFEGFLMQHIRSHMPGGEMLREDLSSFSGGRTTMIDVDERLLDSLRDVFTQLEISYSMLPDLNLEDHNKQLLIPTVQLDLVKNCYRKVMNAYNQSHSDHSAEDLKEITAEEYTRTGMRAPEQYVTDQMKNGDAGVMDNLRNYDTAKGDKEMVLDQLGNAVRSAESLPCAKYLQDDRYLSLSIDDRTLVHNPRDTLISFLHTKHPEAFLCRVPGTFGEHEQVLYVPPEQVFTVSGASEKRFVAFLEKDKAPMIINAPGNPNGAVYHTAEELYRQFDTKSGSPGWKAEGLAPVTAEEINGDWDKSFEERKNDIKRRLREMAAKAPGGSEASVGNEMVQGGVALAEEISSGAMEAAPHL